MSSPSARLSQFGKPSRLQDQRSTSDAGRPSPTTPTPVRGTEGAIARAWLEGKKRSEILLRDPGCQEGRAGGRALTWLRLTCGAGRPGRQEQEGGRKGSGDTAPLPPSARLWGAPARGCGTCLRPCDPGAALAAAPGPGSRRLRAAELRRSHLVQRHPRPRGSGGSLKPQRCPHPSRPLPERSAWTPANPAEKCLRERRLAGGQQGAWWWTGEALRVFPGLGRSPSAPGWRAPSDAFTLASPPLAGSNSPGLQGSGGPAKEGASGGRSGRRWWTGPYLATFTPGRPVWPPGSPAQLPVSGGSDFRGAQVWAQL